MSIARLRVIFLDNLFRTLKQPMLWTLFAVTTFLAWGLSTGDTKIGTGSATVGGHHAWITSEFSNAFIFCIVASNLYAFFISVSAGLAVIRDQESKVEELLHTTRLRTSEYVWGKALSILAAFGVVLALNVLVTILFNHVVPNPAAADIRGPFHVLAYLRPAMLFALPTMAFFGGLTFYVGARLRKPAFAFLAPLAISSLSFTFLWEWTPTWLDPRIDKLLMVLDPSAYRWLNETWLKLDRGAEFYNTATVGLDAVFLANRFLFLGLGALGIVLAQRHIHGVSDRSGQSWLTRLRQRVWRRRSKTSAVAAESSGTSSTFISDLAMRQRPVSYPRQVFQFARAELRSVLSSPALYLFWFFVMLQSVTNSALTRGPFQTRVLMTSGQHAAGAFNTLSLLICFLLLFFTVDALERERATGILSIVGSAPHPTSALILGKNLAMNLLAGLILLASFFAGSFVVASESQLTPQIGPYLMIWGLLMIPTFLLWTALLSAIYAITNSRYQTLGMGLGLISWTLYEVLSGGISWLGNWMLWSGPIWSDLGALELDRQAILLNRLLVLALAGGLLALAAHISRRRDLDATQIIQRLNPRFVMLQVKRLSPAIAVPALVAIPLWFAVVGANNGEAAKSDAHKYWKQNYATWKDAPQPSIASVDVDLWLDPAESSFRTKGSFELLNHHDEALDRFALSGGSRWRDLSWTLNGQKVEPQNRSQLYVFTVDGGLPPGQRVTVGFEFEGNRPDGISKNGGSTAEFILPSGVVLTNFIPTFVPTVGFSEERGVDEDNAMDPPDYAADIYQKELAPAFASARPYPVKIRIDTPEEFLSNSVGVLESEVIENGRRQRVWITDHPVRMFNVVANRWAVHKGEETEIYYHPEHDRNIEAMSRALDASRKYYSEWFAPYPWKELKLSEFPAYATYAQGFPTNITFSENIGFLTQADERTNAVLLVTAHEAAHQWWGNLLTPGKGPGGNILSEGMAHFSTLMLFEELEGSGQRMELAKRFEEAYGNQRRKDAERPLVKTDGSQPGDTVVTYNKGGLVAWMLLEHLGREQMLAGLQEFIQKYVNGPDYPLLEDLIATLRPHAADPEAFDALVDQWFFEVVVPEYRFTEARSRGAHGQWTTTAVLTNHGTGRIEIEVAAVAGERFPGDRKKDSGKTSEYQDARTSIALGSGESGEIRVVSDFEPERLVVDPDVRVLMLWRKQSELTL
ncbi:MAG: hypothetical protein K8J08_08800 [Thermoanaerobaculia bacterium]|nr:hypothetical protein [Thermoanaerobaculia bacterium]